ncbi:MAG TPA: hypothetical protein VFO05_01290 [Candidatus Limnocylindrales bacterium]|nr:hypothetical protein [Candidatus Limnocylindrales bacterium]
MQLPDGGRVTVSIDLDGDGVDDGHLVEVTEAVEVELALAIVTSGDGPSDVEQAVTDVVQAYGLTASSSTRQRTRRITVR